MLPAVDVVLHRIEALPGVGRYAVTFRRNDGSEQTAVMLVDTDHTDQSSDTDDTDDIAVAEASLPVGWTRETDAFRMTAHAVLAVEHARRSGPRSTVLRDVEGGWDVGLGNVELGADNRPTCTAHGAMVEQGSIWVCGDCGAQAIFA